MGHSYGWIPSRPDPRDQVWAVPHDALTPLPAEVSLRPGMPPVYDQGQLGSCTANAIGACVQYQQLKEGRPEGAEIPSRLFIYWNERNLEGTVNSDAGAAIRDGMKVIGKLGAPPETDWPYDTSRFTERPPDQAFTDATNYEARYGLVVQSAHSFQQSVFWKRPVVFGFTVFQSFENIGPDGVMPMPDINTESVLGGHAVVIVGYKQINGHLYFECRNSWGPAWGDQGYFWMPVQYLNDPTYCCDFWHINFES